MSRIQDIALQIIEAAEFEMDDVIRLEAEHGKCYNYRRSLDNDIWVFEDKFEYKVEREREVALEE